MKAILVIIYMIRPSPNEANKEDNLIHRGLLRRVYSKLSKLYNQSIIYFSYNREKTYNIYFHLIYFSYTYGCWDMSIMTHVST